MSLYAKYIQERENKNIIETDQGFATYTIYNNGECYLQDIYVLPEFRKTGIASKMADEISLIAKEKGCKVLTGSVCVTANNSTDSLKSMLAYGMKLHSLQGNMIYLIKEIQ